MIKHILFAAGLAFAASPKQSNIDPYAKYDLMLDNAQANIAKTHAAIAEIQAMNDEKVMEVKQTIEETQEQIEQIEQQMEIVNRVFNSVQIEMPVSLEEWQEDSLRIENMKRINSNEKID